MISAVFVTLSAEVTDLVLHTGVICSYPRKNT